jgi:hypothetical protein
MFSKDLKTELTAAVLLPSQSLSASNNGTGVDLQQYVGNPVVVLNVGTQTGTSPTMDVKLQDSADNSSFADVTGYAFSQKTGTGTDTLALDTRAFRRYVRTVCTLGGTSPVFPTGIVLLGYKQSV